MQALIRVYLKNTGAWKLESVSEVTSIANYFLGYVWNLKPPVFRLSLPFGNICHRLEWVLTVTEISVTPPAPNSEPESCQNLNRKSSCGNLENFTPQGKSWVIGEEKSLLPSCSLKLLPTQSQDQPETFPSWWAVYFSFGSVRAPSCMDPHVNCHYPLLWRGQPGRGQPGSQPSGALHTPLLWISSPG